MIHILIDNKKTDFPPPRAPPADDPQTQPLHEEAGWCGQRIQFVPHYALAYPPYEQNAHPHVAEMQ